MFLYRFRHLHQRRADAPARQSVQAMEQGLQHRGLEIRVRRNRDGDEQKNAREQPVHLESPLGFQKHITFQDLPQVAGINVPYLMDVDGRLLCHSADTVTRVYLARA